jgi:hypothetical protein
MKEDETNMHFDDETLMAYIDGELDVETVAAIESALQGDSDLAARIEQQKKFRNLVSGAFDDVLEEAIPDRLLQTARIAPAGNVVSLDSARETISKRTWSWREWGAMAASLLLGVLIARGIGLRSADTLVAGEGHLVASGALAAALNNQPGGERVEGAPVQIGFSYQAKSGEYCRTFNASGREAMAGIACRADDGWAVQALVRDQAMNGTANYRMASTTVPPSLLQIVQDSIEGEALDRQAEDALRARGWKAKPN